MPDLLTEVARFRAWTETYPGAGRSGEWECDYDHWTPLSLAVLAFLDVTPFTAWSDEERAAVLYAVARDNEVESLAHELRERGPLLLLDVAEAAVRAGEPDAKWQLAEQLGRFPGDSARREELLLALARDGDEYVRRRALQALARTASPETERLALEAWQRPDEAQQWARMNALWALHRVGSAHLDRLLTEAERDGHRFPYLSDFAAKVRRGDVDPQAARPEDQPAVD